MQAYLAAVLRRLIALGFAPCESPLADAGQAPVLALARALPEAGVLQLVALVAADGVAAGRRDRLVTDLARGLLPAAAGRSAQLLVMHVYGGALQAADLQATDGLPRTVDSVSLAHWVIDLETAMLARVAGSVLRDGELEQAVHPRGVWAELVRPAASATAGARSESAAMGPAGPAVSRPVTAPYLTYGLLAVIGLMFLALEATGGSEDPYILLYWGAKYGPAIVEDGQAWRLLSSVFLHGGYSHVLLNSLALWHMGRLAEALFGHWRYAAVFFLSGLLGSLLSLALGPYKIPGVGASGAIFGLFGAMIYFRLAAPRRFPVQWAQLLWPVAINLFVGVVIPMVDNWAHVGGLLGGLGASALVGVPGRFGPLRGLALAVVIVLALLVVGGFVPVGVF